jgi:hypothetical protein
VRASFAIAGVAVMADWVGSSALFAYHNEPMPLATYWNNFALKTAESACESLAFAHAQLGGSAVVLSATLPQVTRQRFDACSICPLYAAPRDYQIANRRSCTARSDLTVRLKHHKAPGV